MRVDSIDALSPVDGRLLKTFALTSEQELDEKVNRCRRAAKIWMNFSVDERLDRLSRLTDHILANIDAISDRLVEASGKVKTEIILGEVYPVLEMLKYYRKTAAKILAPQLVSTSVLAFPDATAGYDYRPYGVVAVISPWNYPFQLTLYPLLSALIAGNGVLFKTSEFSLPVGELICELMAELDLPDGLVQWVIGGPEIGQKMIERRPDLVFFTGGRYAGCNVMTTAAMHPIPVILELGGKDAMVVFADAQIERAVKAALYGAFTNSGQVCVSIERLYVEESIYESFLQKLREELKKLKVGSGDDADIGAITVKKQQEVIEAHYRDAVAKGAKASGELKFNGSYLYPVVLWDITENMLILQEETFGPLLPVLSFSNEQEVVGKINADEHGLNASVWSLDFAKAQRVVGRLEVGNWVVNDVLKNVGHPRLPFGGVKMSGFGRYHGAEGLRSFVYPVSGVVSRSQHNREPNWFPYSRQSYRQMRALLDFLFGRQVLWRRLKNNWRDLQVFREFASLNAGQHWRNFMVFIKRYQN